MGSSGVTSYRSEEGDTWLLRSSALSPELSLAVARNYSLASVPVRRAGWLLIGAVLLLGVGSAFVFVRFYQPKPESLDQVTASVAAFAHGNLDEDLLLKSSDDMRLLADNLNAMKDQLREQLAREAEARQFTSFLKLSAMLAHDLKNAIEGLSLTVGNMEKHFDNPQFREDMMIGLTASTNKLRQLVTRLSNPASTLSGEFRMPRPTDLVPLLKHVIAEIAEPLRERHQLEVDLPASLFALADAERVEKVMENLVLNAVEAMGQVPGKLTIAAGGDDRTAFFSISDTGPGMTQAFIKNQLFRPFSTTKDRGIGLGLYTCREVIRANSGSIEVESEPGSGTTFRVVLASARL